MFALFTKNILNNPHSTQISNFLLKIDSKNKFRYTNVNENKRFIYVTKPHELGIMPFDNVFQNSSNAK